MIISRTPFRISFFGGGTDYPTWYSRHGGSVLGTAIDKYCYITCRYLPPFFEHRYRVVWSMIERCKHPDEITHPVVRTLIKHLGIERGVEVHHDGDLPARSGMGSSSAFTVGLLHALHALQGNILSRHKLATESIYVERELLKETVGSQDQVFAAYGGFNRIRFSPEGEISVQPMTLDADRIQELNDHLLLFYTGIARTASSVASSYVNELENKSSALERMTEMVDEGVQILSSLGSILPLGELLHDAWQLKRSLSTTVSNGQVEEIYREALAAGAIGGKLTGAGGGGFLLLFVPPEQHRDVRQRLQRLTWVPFRFAKTGSEIIFFDVEQDYRSHDRDATTQMTIASSEGSEATLQTAEQV